MKGNANPFSVKDAPLFETTLSLSSLSSHLWEAANILRGPVDAADFKTYIFPLLFFKRISDVFEEEMTEAMPPADIGPMDSGADAMPDFS